MDISLFVLPCYREGIAPSLGHFYDEIAETVRLADRLGWRRAWCSEHHFHYYGGASPNPAMTLLAWAGQTERIRLGAGVVLLPLNHPLRVAEDYAVLDQMSGGRLDLGIGRGYLPHEFKGFDRTPDDATARFEEAHDIVTRAWRGEPFAHHGDIHRFEKLRVLPQPVQEPVPLWVACSRTRESFEWTATQGYGLLMNQYPMRWSEMAERFGWYRDAWAGAGHDPNERRAMMALFLHIADSEEQAIAEAKPWVREHANLFRLLFAGDVFNTDYGGDDSVFAFLTGEDDVDIAALFRERTLVGTADQIAERIAAYRALGFTEISLIARYGEMPHTTSLANIESFERDIRPAVAAKTA